MALGDKTDIQIFGRRLSVSLDGLTALETNQCANLVDSRMREIAGERKIADSSKLAILAALEIAAELSRVRTELENLNPVDEQRVEKMIVALENTVDAE